MTTLHEIAIKLQSSEKVTGEPYLLAWNAQGDLDLARELNDAQPGRASRLRTEARNKLFKAVRMVTGSRPKDRHEAWHLLSKTLLGIAV